MKYKEDAAAYLKSIVRDHLAANGFRYKLRVHNGQLGINMLGLQVEPQPAEGKFIAQNDDWAVLKTGRSEFFVIDKDFLPSIPNIGDTVLLTPNKRMNFNGKKLGEDEQIQTKDGYTTRTIRLGETMSYFPINKKELKTTELAEMLTQIESLPSPDGIRTIAQVLIHAGARDTNIKYNDPLPKDIISSPPSVTFEVDTKKLSGTIEINYDRGIDYYRVITKDKRDPSLNKSLKDIDFTSLGEVIDDLVDDGDFKMVKVDVIKPAPSKRPKM